MKLTHDKIQPSSRTNQNRIRRGLRSFTIATTLAFCGCGASMTENIQTPQSQVRRSPDPATPVTADSYSSNTDPFELDERLQSIADSLTGTPEQMVRQLFERIRVGGSEGMRYVDSENRPPRTAAQTLTQGGDCSELATVIIAILRAKNIPGGAISLHFEESPENINHMVAFVTMNGEHLFFDPQADQLDQIDQGNHTILLRYSFDQAAYVYHKEWADYFSEIGDTSHSIIAYESAIEIFDGDALNRINLSAIYANNRDYETSLFHIRRAYELNPSLFGEGSVGRHNLFAIFHNAAIGLVEQAEQAFNGRDWNGCAQIFQRILDNPAYAIVLEQETLNALEENRDACQYNAETDQHNVEVDQYNAEVDRYNEMGEQVSRAFNEGRYADCVRLIQEYLESGGERSESVLHNLRLCQEAAR